jgi:HSP20 family protein
MLTLRNGFFDLLDRNFDDFSGYTGLREPESKFSGFTPEVESYQKDNNLMFRMAVPGVDPKDVDVSIQGRYLNIKAERQRPADVKEEDRHLRGFSYGRIEGTWILPESVDLNKIEANFNNGGLRSECRRPRNFFPRRLKSNSSN